MSSIYFKADSQTHHTAYDIISKYHPDLRAADIKVGILMALSNKENQPAIKEGGMAVEGTIKIVSLKDRITKGFDVEIILDGDVWKQNDKNQIAILDHLLSRLEIKKNKKVKNKSKNEQDEHEEKDNVFEEEQFVTDDIGRPVIKFRQFDWNAGAGFTDVVARHGDCAPECRNVLKAMELIAQSKSPEDQTPADSSIQGT